VPAREGEAAPKCWYSYAVLRVVPRVEREEFLNVGVILFAREQNYLDLRLALDEGRLRALAPDLPLAPIRQHLQALQAIGSGEPPGGEIAALSPSERFHWLTTPRSTIIQPSPIHVGCAADPRLALDELMDSLVLPLTQGSS
jgi:hypothetical protein